MDKVHADDDNTLDSGSGSASGYSDLTGLENETDTLGRRIIQHQRDAQRLKHAIYGSQQTFKRRREEHLSKFKGGQKVSARERGDRRGVQLGDYDSNDLALPVTVPREWGRQGRTSASWMRKIQQPSEPDVEESHNYSAKLDDYAVRPYHTIYTDNNKSQRDGISADGLLQLTNSDTTPHKHDLPSPSSLRHMNTTLKLSQEYDEQDFSGGSFLASTPAPSRLPRKIDEIVRRETEDSRVNGADKIRAQLSTIEFRSRDRGLVAKLNTQTRENPLRKVKEPITFSPSRIPRRLDNPSRNKENLPPADEIHGGSNEAQIDKAESQSVQPVNLGYHGRRHHQRDDSLALLRKLARVSSMSPSPARGLADLHQPHLELERGDDDSLKGLEPGQIGIITKTKDETAGTAIPADVKSRDEVSIKDTKPVSPTSLDGERESTGTGDRVDRKIHVAGQTDAQNPPGETKGSSPAETKPLPALSQEETRSLAKSYGLDLPRSALEAIVRDAKAEKAAHKYSESTIQSLEDIINPNLDPSEPTVTFDTASEPQQQSGDRADLHVGRRRLTQAEKDRRQENLAMEAMNRHLRAARTSIKDANRGLRRVENKVDTVHEDPAMDFSQPQRGPTHGQCPNCSRPHASSSSMWYELWLEFRSLFYIPEISIAPKTWPRIPLTTLGLILLIAALWFVTESVLCAYYCHPLYATYMIDYGVDPNAPDFPFVIPTLAFRPFRPILEPLWDAVVAGGAVLFHASSSPPSNTPTRLPTIIKTIAKSSRRTILPHASSTAGEDGVSTSWGAAFTSAAWMDTAARTTARVAASVVDAVDGMGDIWEDDLVL